MIDRRRLLLGAGGLSLAATAVSAAAQGSAPKAVGQPLLGHPDLPDQPSQRMRWAIVGLGTFALGQVIPGFMGADESTITAFVSGNPDKAKELGARYGVSKLYSYDTFDKIAEDKEIDCVYIVLPVGLHAEYTIRALKAGKHVLCEKPMASTPAECEAMIADAKAANRQLGVAYRVHFEPNNVEVARRCASGELGTLRYFTGDAGFNANPDWPPHKWRLQKALAGGGSMYDIGIYAMNAAMMCLGEDPVSVSAVYSYPRDDPRFREVEGGVDWRMTFPSGIHAQGSSSYCYAGGTRQKIFGATGAIVMEPASDYYRQNVTLSNGQPLNAGNPISQFAAQVDGFSKAARANVAHLTPGEMGLRDIRIIQAMYKSADNDGMKVML
ncbi:MAG: Gfo/Idh/MocA family protein [Asticcacaulis sp.]|uniref:Gfo/Idh/MocA family protein n=1 Tax=Asticcacaulis sp. TaxID=1872648 RepID=UPI003F7BB156